MKLQSCSSEGIEAALKSLQVLSTNPDLREKMGRMGQKRFNSLFFTGKVCSTIILGSLSNDGETWEVSL